MKRVFERLKTIAMVLWWIASGCAAPMPAVGPGRTVVLSQGFSLAAMQDAVSAAELWAAYGASLSLTVRPAGQALTVGLDNAVPVYPVDGPGEAENWAGIYDASGVRIDIGRVASSGYELRRVFAHEFGHVLGVSHQMTEGDVMCMGPCFASSDWVLSDADVAAIAPIYRIAP